MSVPTYDKFIEPILRYLAEHPEGATASAVHEACASRLGLTPEAMAEMLPSGQQLTYKNRAGWAHDRLKRGGLSTSPRRGFWRLTKLGLEFVKSHPGPLSDGQLEDMTTFNTGLKLKNQLPGQAILPPSVTLSDVPSPQLSPDDRLNTALQVLREATARDLLEAIAQGTPTFFETLVLDLLLAMGYGAGRDDLQRVGKPGDGGIDGIISLDRLGFEKVYVQAKRWSNTIGREAVQAFYGALAGQRAQKGVFITTSSFTQNAVDFARSVERIVLIDGNRLSQLMMDYGVGVTHRALKIARIDRDYFEEGS